MTSTKYQINPKSQYPNFKSAVSCLELGTNNLIRLQPIAYSPKKLKMFVRLPADTMRMLMRMHLLVFIFEYFAIFHGIKLIGCLR